MTTGRWVTFEGFEEFFLIREDGTPYLGWLQATAPQKWLRFELSFVGPTTMFSVGPVRDGASGEWVDDGPQVGAHVTRKGIVAERKPQSFVAHAHAMVPRMEARLRSLLLL